MLTFSIAPSFALAASQPNYASMSSDQLAYCDLKTAPKEWQSAILAARYKIIENKSWTVNGQCAIVNADGTIQKLPEFSTLFPGWAVPTSKDATEYSSNAVMQPNAASPNYAGYVDLQYPSLPALPFYQYQPDHGPNVMKPGALLPGTSWNGSYWDLTTSTQIGAGTYLTQNQSYNLYNPDYSHTYGTVASTFSTPGKCYFTVT